MKLIKKIISVLLVVIFAFSTSVSSVAAYVENKNSRPEILTLSEYKTKLWEEGYPVFTTKQFLDIFNTLSLFVNIITGKGFHAGEKFDVEVDTFVTDACNEVYQNCGLDIVSLLSNVPALNSGAELITTVFNVDIDTIREEMYDKRDAYEDEGNGFMTGVCFFLGAYLAIMDKCEIYAVPTEENPDVYEVQLKVTYRNGEYDIHCPGIFIDSVTGECTGYDADQGLLGIGFNFNINEMMVYATINAWMRDFGFCMFYDIAANSAPLLWHYDTRRFTFDYNGLEWMVQMWKGNYLITNGAEVGVYNRTPDKFGSFYDCASNDQLMEMSLQVYHGEDLLVNQEPQPHWWINGFQMSDRIYVPASLTLVSSIVMYDEEMVRAFCEAIDKNYYHDVTYTVDGLKVSFVW